MPRFVRPFKIQLPVITLPVTHGARPAIVLFSMSPAGTKEGLCMSTCIDIEGRGYQNVPFAIEAIRAACLDPMTFIETDDGIVAPRGGLILPGQS
jgi:hypothetical protein